MPRKSIQTDGFLGKLSLNREIEFFVQMLGWGEKEILTAVKAAHPDIKDDEAVTNHIRVARSRFRTEKKDIEEMNKAVGKGEVSSLDAVTDIPISRFQSGMKNIDLLWGFSEEEDKVGFPRGQVSLLSGAAGVGKSRMMIALCGVMTDPDVDNGLTALYWQNEFALPQFKTMTNSRIKENSRFKCGDIRSLKEQIAEASAIKPDLVIVDSIQMLEEANSKAGLERCISAYKCAAYDHGFHVLFIGQLNKKGQASGSEIFRHLVDATFMAVKDKASGGFKVFSTKNRWGVSGLECLFRHSKEGVDPIGEVTISEE